MIDIEPAVKHKSTTKIDVFISDGLTGATTKYMEVHIYKLVATLIANERGGGKHR